MLGKVLGKVSVVSAISIKVGLAISSLFQGGNFHLKVGRAKSSGNAGDPMLGVAVSGGSRIYKRGVGIK